MRELVGKPCVFSSHGEDTYWRQYDGSKCIVLDRKPERDYDFMEMGSMWGVRFGDGTELDAYAFELEPMKG